MSLDTLRQKYPYLAYAFNDPEVAAIMEQADREQWPPEKVQAALTQTSWFKTQSDSQRNYHATANSDPASFWQLVQQKADIITDMAARLGLDMSPEQIYEAAKAALYFGRSDADIQRSLLAGGAVVSARSSTQQQVKALASDYFLNLAPSVITDWTQKITSGQYTIDNARAQFADWAKQLYPHLATQIDSGLTLRQYAEPYRQSISSILEMNPNNVDMGTDPRWKQVLGFTDEKGTTRAMTLTEAEKYARSQPEWQYTKGAMDQAANLDQTLLTTFGMVA